jgi:hypothetical protein
MGVVATRAKQTPCLILAGTTATAHFEDSAAAELDAERPFSI